MNICIPIEKDEGLSSQMCLHFSTAPKYMIVDTKTLGYRIVVNGKASSTGEGPVDLLAGDRIDSVVVGGIGINTLNHFQEAGIDVFSTREDTVEDIIVSVKEGAVNPVSVEHTCRFQHSGRGFRGPGGCSGSGRCG